MDADLESESLFACIEQLDPNAILPVVYAGGFEHNPSQIERIAESRKLLGNSASVLTELKNPRLFSNTVSELGIPAPRTRFDGPESSSVWLYKSAGGSGGLEVGGQQNSILSAVQIITIRNSRVGRS